MKISGILNLIGNYQVAGSKFCVQAYYPKATIENGEFYFTAETVLRIIFNSTARGFGFQVIGFGFGVVYFIDPLD